jgi:hypothetical protein
MPRDPFPPDFEQRQAEANKEYALVRRLGDLYVNLLKCSRSSGDPAYLYEAAESLRHLLETIDLGPKTTALEAVELASHRVCWQETPRQEYDQHLDRITRVAITYMVEASGYNEQRLLTKRKEALVREIDAFNEFREERRQANRRQPSKPLRGPRRSAAAPKVPKDPPESD